MKWILYFLLTFFCMHAHAGVVLKPASDSSGYLARLLINEAAFPGERGFVSVKDSKSAMLAVLWVLHARRDHIPSGYTQKRIAAVRSDDIIDLITAGGIRGQCDGFYRDTQGHPTMVPRVEARVKRLVRIANTGAPGRFAELLQYAQSLTIAYMNGGIHEADRFASLSRIANMPVTGRAFSWMAGQDTYHPGGNFVRIPNEYSGLLGGNRFFTLRKLP